MVTRHEFLSWLHELLRPEVYLEVGVQYGDSLRLATHSKVAIGVDPAPHVGRNIPNAQIYPMTSDEFFMRAHKPGDILAALYEPIWIDQPIDLAFIDGMHLFENVWADFNNVERLCRPGAVVVFDDVLPTTQAMAARVQCPGDWTGDVWKIYPALRQMRPDLKLTLVDTFPTGLLVVQALDPALPEPSRIYLRPVDPTAGGEEVPSEVLTRRYAEDPHVVLAQIRERRE